VTCKIVHVSSGEEMATKARELARHFETQGTPVMIGALCLIESVLCVHNGFFAVYVLSVYSK